MVNMMLQRIRVYQYIMWSICNKLAKHVSGHHLQTLALRRGYWQGQISLLSICSALKCCSTLSSTRDLYRFVLGHTYYRDQALWKCLLTLAEGSSGIGTWWRSNRDQNSQCRDEDPLLSSALRRSVLMKVIWIWWSFFFFSFCKGKQ